METEKIKKPRKKYYNLNKSKKTKETAEVATPKRKYVRRTYQMRKNVNKTIKSRERTGQKTLEKNTEKSNFKSSFMGHNLLHIIFRLPFYKLFYYLGFPKILPLNYTISLTNRCNSNCSTCFIYNKKVKELDLEEYKKIFHHLGKSPYWVTFSGGEPFLRKDFVDIVKAFYDACKPKIINIPTNGIQTTKIVKEISEICEYCVKSKIIINFSIDGIGEEHDNIRNVPGNYQKVLKSFKESKKLEHKNLSIGIHTVISKFNVDNFARISNTLMQQEPDQYITEIAEQRQELQTIGLDIVPELLNYRAAVDLLIHRIKHSYIKKGINRITQAFRIEYYNLSKAILRYQTQIIPCYAGITSVQIAPDGDVWTCCIKAKSVGNLKDYKYNLKNIWKDKKIKKERALIKNKDCHCPLANVSYTNMLLDFRTLARVVLKLGM